MHLVVDNLWFRYSRKSESVLQGINLRIEGGSSVAFVGPSGSGKSTLLAVVAGLRRPTEGVVQWFADGVPAPSPQAQWVPQSNSVLPDRTVLDNVVIAGLSEGQSRGEAESRAYNLLASVGLSSAAHRTAGTLSGGQQQRVACARALCAGSALICADEPTANLDQSSTRLVTDALGLARNDRRSTLIVATHDQSVADAADHVYSIVDGQCTTAGG